MPFLAIFIRNRYIYFDLSQVYIILSFYSEYSSSHARFITRLAWRDRVRERCYFNVLHTL